MQKLAALLRHCTILGLIMASSPTQARPSYAHGSDPIPKECNSDYSKLIEKKRCLADTGKQMKQDCLYQNYAAISKTCQVKIKKGHANWKKKHEAFASLKAKCQSEVKKLKIGSEPKKHVLVQFMMNPEQLSDSCKAEANKYIEAHTSNLRQIE
jgi:hypothetical protein